MSHWQNEAACRSADPTLFEEPLSRGRRKPAVRRLNKDEDAWADDALWYCDQCPVKNECFQDYLKECAENATYGIAVHARTVRGGLFPRELDVIRRRA